MTQAQVARRFGFTQQDVSDWEMDRKMVPDCVGIVYGPRPHELVRLRRERLGMTQAQMALTVGCSRMSVWKAERGLAPKTLQRMEVWLGGGGSACARSQSKGDQDDIRSTRQCGPT